MNNGSRLFLDVKSDQRLRDAVNKLVAAEVHTRVAENALYAEYKIRGSDPGDKLMMAETAAQTDRAEAIAKVVEAFNVLRQTHNTQRKPDADAA
jgi:hypothetical protein